MLLALLHPGAVDGGLQMLTRKGVCPMLPCSLAHSLLDQEQLGISSDPSGLERNEGASLGGGITEEGAHRGEDRGKWIRKGMKEDMINTENMSISLEWRLLFIMGSRYFSIDDNS